jgi:hypothetical protein
MQQNALIAVGVAIVGLLMAGPGVSGSTGLWFLGVMALLSSLLQLGEGNHRRDSLVCSATMLGFSVSLLGASQLIATPVHTMSAQLHLSMSTQFVVFGLLLTAFTVASLSDNDGRAFPDVLA